MPNIELPWQADKIISELNKKGFQAYAVGGCVRDSLLGRIPSDWDVTTSANPKEIKECFNKTVDTGIEHGTVTVLLGGGAYEVTTYRIDGTYSDGRHPDSVVFTPDLKEDLLRRDFTINAMAYHPGEGVVDLFGGMEDLKKGVIRCVGDPSARFSEDALRMMRAVRFCAQLGFSVERGTFEAVCALSGNLAQVSAERIREEFFKLLASDRPRTVDLFRQTGLTAVFLPEYDAMFQTEQNTPHHCFNVGEHTLAVLEETAVRSDSLPLRLAALFHDMAKPRTRKTDPKGVDHFVGHPQAGARLCRQILRRLKTDNATTDRVSSLVKFHDERFAPTKRNVRRLMARAGSDLMPELLMLRRADVAGQSEYGREKKLTDLDRIEEYYKEILAEGECITLKDLAIDGRTLIELGIPAGPMVGEVLSALLKMVIDEPEKNTESALRDEAKRFL